VLENGETLVLISKMRLLRCRHFNKRPVDTFHCTSAYKGLVCLEPVIYVRLDGAIHYSVGKGASKKRFSDLNIKTLPFLGKLYYILPFFKE